MQGHAAFGVHFALAIKTEGFLRLGGQCGALLLVFIERQPATAKCLEGQLFGFFCCVGAQFRRRMVRTPGKDGGDNQ